MELIPRVTLKNYKITNESISLENLSDYIKEGDKLYILDLDGIEKNRTNIDFFQRLSSIYDLWIDCGPRNIGDVVDIFMMGATSVTIRKTKYSRLNVSEIRDISENKIYLNIDLNDYKNYNLDISFFKDFDGIINFNDKEEIEEDIEYREHINKIKTENKIYCYENNIKNYLFWESFGVTGLLIDINKSKEFRNAIGT